MSEGAGNWCLIESDPGVFTEMIKEFGVKGLQVEELWSLDPENFERLGQIHGLIFLFKWMGSGPTTESSGTVVEDSRLESIFFAKQVIQNACATQALISVLLNCNAPNLELGSVLADFQEFTKSFDPSMKGLALSNSPIIREVHNSFSRQTIFEFDQKLPSKDDDVYHFVGFVPIQGRLYELDGLQEGPIDLGGIPEGKDWTEVVREVLRERISKYAEGEIHFNLLAVISDLRLQLESQLRDMQAAGSDPKAIEDLKQQIEDEDAKRAKYKLENIRRKHNYLPLIVQFLKELAEKKQLMAFYEDAKTKAAKSKS